MRFLLKILTLVVFSLSTFSVLSQDQLQDPSDTNSDWRIQYKEKTITFYSVDDSEVLSNLDKAMLKYREETNMVEKHYSSPLNMPLVYIDNIESINMYEDYMVAPASYVIDEVGIHSYDGEGKLLNTIPHTEKYKSLAANRGRNIFYSIPSLHNSPGTWGGNSGISSPHSDSQGGSLDSRGEISIDDSGIITLEMPNATFQYNPNNWSETIIVKNSSGDTVRTMYRQYQLVTAINAQHRNPSDAVVVYKREMNKTQLPSGAEAEFVKIKQYSEYEIQRKTPSESRTDEMDERKSQELRFFPNPVKDVLHVTAPDKKCYRLKIYSIAGKKILDEEHVGSTIVDLSRLDSGVYLISLEGEDEKHIGKFIKH